MSQMLLDDYVRLASEYKSGLGWRPVKETDDLYRQVFERLAQLRNVFSDEEIRCWLASLEPSGFISVVGWFVADFEGICRERLERLSRSSGKVGEDARYILEWNTVLNPRD